MGNFFYRQQNKRLLQRLFIDGRGRAIGRPLYNAMIAAELAWHRVTDALLSSTPGDQSLVNQEATILVKTFERPAILSRLLGSVRRFYPHVPIIVVDDSRQPHHYPGVQTIAMPFNSGISAGRNEGLRHVSTPYVLLLDDDFVFYRRTNLADALARMKREPRIDMMGGAVVDLPFYRVTDYRRTQLFPTEARPLLPLNSSLAGLPVYDKVANFLLAQAESLRRVGWDEQLKLVEHADFFTRARGVLCTVFNRELRCLHARTLFDKQYMAYREDIADAQAYLLSKHYGFGQARSGAKSAAAADQDAQDC